MAEAKKRVRGRPKKDHKALGVPDDAAVRVEQMAREGHTLEHICNEVGLAVYDLKEGDFSTAYKKGRAAAKSQLMAKVQKRALNDDYRGADYNAFVLLRMVHGLGQGHQVESPGEALKVVFEGEQPAAPRPA